MEVFIRITDILHWFTNQSNDSGQCIHLNFYVIQRIILIIIRMNDHRSYFKNKFFFERNNFTNGWNKWTVTCSMWNYVSPYIFQNLNGNVMTDSKSLNNSKESIIEVPSNRIYSSVTDSEVGMSVSMDPHERYK